MSFILLLVLSMSTLVRMEAASSATDIELMRARQSAVVALQVAIGELQKHAGPDRRVSATAEIMNGSASSSGPIRNPHWTGVWKNSSVNSLQPGGTHYAPQLLTWLVSGNERIGDPIGSNDAIATFNPEDEFQRNAAQLSPSVTDDAVTLVGANSTVLSVDDQDSDGMEDGGGVVAPLVRIGSNNGRATGRYAYWVGDEGVKARSNLRDPLAGASEASEEGLRRLAVPGRTGVEIFSRDIRGGGSASPLWGLDYIVNASSAEQVFLPSEMAYLLDVQADEADTMVRERFHDFSLHSEGLLSDAKNGGLKQDLTTANRLSNASWQDFKASLTNDNPQLIFPPVSGSASPADPGGPGWDVLRSFVTNSFTGVGDKLIPRVQTPNTHGFAPVVQEFKMFVGLSLVGSGSSRNVRIHYMPVVTLWNPYDHTLAAQDYYMTFGPLYPYLNVYLGLNPVHWAESGGSPDLTAQMKYNIGSGHRNNPPQITSDRAYRFRVACPDIPPGRAIVFSPPDGGRAMALSSNLPTNSAPFNLLEPGWREGSNYYITLNGYTDGSLQPDDEIYHMSISGGEGAYSDLRVGLTPTGVSDNPLLVVHDILFWYLHDWTVGGGFQHMSASRYPRVTLSSQGGEFTQGSFTDALGNYYTDTFEPVFGYWMQLRMSEKVLPEAYHLPHPWLKSYNPRGPFYGQSLIESRANGQAPRGFGNLPSYYRLLAVENFSSLYNVNSNGEFTFPGYSVNSLSGERSVLYRAFEEDSDFLSIGDLMHANLVPDAGNANDNLGYANYGSNYPNYAVGSSAQSPYIAADAVTPYRNQWPSGTDNTFFGGENLTFYDLPYLLNEALWDRFFFSSIDRNGTEVFNSRLVPLREGALSVYDAENVKSFAADFGIEGAFNVNSTSVEAWSSVLGAFLGVDSSGESASESESFMNRVPFPQGTSFSAGHSADEDQSWSGSRILSTNEIRGLASEIVEEVKLRGPFLSLAQFVNRDIAAPAGASQRKAGALDAAIESAALNVSLEQPIGSNKLRLDVGDFAAAGSYYSFENYNLEPLLEALTAQIPGALSQPDLLAKFGSILSVRSDTFSIRAYGDALDPVGGEPVARAWAEAVVQRTVEPVEASSSDSNEPNSATAESLGRRFKIVSFRWLGQNEI